MLSVLHKKTRIQSGKAQVQEGCRRRERGEGLLEGRAYLGGWTL